MKLKQYRTICEAIEDGWYFSASYDKRYELYGGILKRDGVNCEQLCWQGKGHTTLGGLLTALLGMCNNRKVDHGG